MTSPGFHSATLLVHLSGLWAAIRRARRHFSFFLCFDTFCVVVCQHFSSESLALRFMYSVQTSNSSSWLHVLSVSFSDEILLSWPYSSFVLSSSCVSSLIVLFVRMTRRSSLRWVVPEHVFVFFCFRPCSGTIRHIVDVTTASKRCNLCRRK